MIWNRISVSLAFFVCGFVYTNWSTRLPRIQTLFNLDNTEIGFMLLCVALGSLISMPLTGVFIAKKGGKTATIISLIFFSLSLFIFQWVQTSWQLASSFLFLGFFTGALDVAMNTQAVAVEHKYKKSIMASFHAIFSLGMMLGALFSSFIIKRIEDLTFHFNLVSGLSVVISLVCIPYLVTDLPSEAETESRKGVLRYLNFKTILLGILAFCAMLAEGSIADWGTNYLKNIIEADEYISAIGISVFSISMMSGRFIADGIRQKYSDAKTIIYGSFMAAIGLFVSLSYLSIPVFMGGLVLVGFGISAVIPIIYSSAGNLKELPSGIGLSVVTTFGYAGFLVGPPIIGYLGTLFNLRVALFFVVGLLLLLGILSRRAVSLFEKENKLT
jgi:MFS family permease